jgi:hypothetical protein
MDLLIFLKSITDFETIEQSLMKTTEVVDLEW